MNVRAKRTSLPTTSDTFSIYEEMLKLSPKLLWREFKAQHFSFICICIYLIFEYIKPEQAYAIFGILPFLRFSLIGAIVGFYMDKQSRYTGSILHWLFFLLVLHCVISSIYAYNPEYSFDRLNVIVLWLIIYLLVTGIVTSEKRLFLFVIVYFLANFKMSQFGFISWAKRGFGFASWGITGAGWFRNSGELGLQMSMFFAYSLCFAIFFRQHWRGWIKWLMYFLPFSAAGCVLATSSRGAIVGGIGVLLYLSFFSKRKIRAWISTALFLFLAYLIMPPEFTARFQTAGTDATSLSRITYWGKAREMMDMYPYFGAGYYNWVVYYRDHYFDPTLYWRVEEAHNTYLQMGAELGYPGLGLFILMVLASFWINFKTERMCREPGFEFVRAFAMGMNAAGIGLVLASIFLTAFFLPNYWFHFAFTVCLASIVKQKRALLNPPKRK